MQFKVLSLLSVVLAIVLAMTTTLQAAPTPSAASTPAAARETPAPAGETHAPATPTKAASTNASFSGVNQSNNSTKSGVAARGSANTEEPQRAANIECWDAYISGRVFAITCYGNPWYEWVDCSNGYRYTSGAWWGTWRVTTICPWGTIALRGGAY